MNNSLSNNRLFKQDCLYVLDSTLFNTLFNFSEIAMKKIALLAPLLALTLSGCGKNEVGDVSLGFFTLKDIKISNLDDEKIPGVTCHIASVEANLSLSDPSDSSISCRQTGDITPEMIASIDKSKSGEVVFKQSKSVFFKTMKVRRIYDAENQTLLYLSYTTKETDGSFKHSLSTVPLWHTLAYQSADGVPATLPESDSTTSNDVTKPQTVGDAASKNSEVVF